MTSQEMIILYIEDNSTNRFLMEMVFKNFSGYTLKLAIDAEQGLEEVYTSLPNLILMDKDLPKMSGIEATQLLKSDGKYQNIPIIMLTADYNEETIRKAKSVGCDLVEPKPFDIVKLRAQITDLVTN